MKLLTAGFLTVCCVRKVRNWMDDRMRTFRFSPHWTEILKPRVLIPAGAGVCVNAFLLLRGRFGKAEILMISVFLSVSLWTLLSAEIHRRRTIIEIRGEALTCLSPSCEKTLKRQGIDRVEIHGTSVGRILGGVRLRIYSDASSGAWLSVSVSRKRVNEMIGHMIPLGEETGKTVPGRHSAAIYAVTSERTTLLLLASAFFTLSARDSIALNAAGAFLSAAAVMNLLAAFARFRRLSLSRRSRGFIISSGFWGMKRIYLPENAVAGAVIRRSPAAVLCGFGALWMLTYGGALIPCACRVNDGEGVHSAMKLIGAENGYSAKLSDIDAIRKKYASSIIPAVFGVFLSAYFALGAESVPSRFFACLAGAFLTSTAVRGLVGFRCADSFGLNVSPSAIFAGGMKGCSAEYYIFRRGCLAGVRIRSSLFERMNRLCCAIPFTSCGRRGVKCSCVLYGAVNGFTARFCG